MSDQHVDADRIRITLNATLALAAHHGLILDRDGHTVTPPEDATLRGVVTRVLYARHRLTRFGVWDELSDHARAIWETRADVAIDAAPTMTVPDLADYLRQEFGDEHRGELAPWIITAHHVKRLIDRQAEAELWTEAPW